MRITREILLVDDNPADSDLTREVLAASSHPNHVTTLLDGEAAIALLRRTGPYGTARRPDLIILDLNLPRIDGRAVLAEIKTDPELNQIPVVIFSTSHSAQEVARCYELGANCYLRKPVSLSEFFSAVQSLDEFWIGFASLPKQEI